MKKMAIFLALLMMLPLAAATDFELEVNDAQGDVSNPDIDITKAWTTVEGSNIVVHIKVAGKINDEYAYWVTATDGNGEIGAVYSNGLAYYAGGTSGGQPDYSINGDTLSIKLPSGLFSGWQHFSFQAFAGKYYGSQRYDFTSEAGNTGSNGDNDNNGGNPSEDPTKGDATDGSISIDITHVEYELHRENANMISGHVAVKGTTNGADHVSLTFVVYYKNGTYDYGSWIVGPSEFNQDFGGYSINEFFNSTDGNWNKWEFNMSGTYPMTDYNWAYDMLKGESEVSKVVVYARAFKDSQETKWNQAKYETVPSFSTNGISYGTNSGEQSGGTSSEDGENNEKSKTPGFEFAFAAAAIVSIAFLRKRQGK